jgi:hypothetical protein
MPEGFEMNSKLADFLRSELNEEVASDFFDFDTENLDEREEDGESSVTSSSLCN